MDWLTYHEPPEPIELGNGMRLHIEWHEYTSWWAMWLESNGKELEADPYDVLGGSFEEN